MNPILSACRALSRLARLTFRTVHRANLGRIHGVATGRAGLAGAALLSVAVAGAAEVAPGRGASALLQPDGGRLMVEVHGVPAAPPAFFSAQVAQTVRAGRDEITGELRVRLRVVQGQPEVMTLGVSGDGEIVDVSGKGLRDWSVRRAAGAAARLLDVRVLPADAAGRTPGPATASGQREFEVLIRTRQRPRLAEASSVLILTPGDAVGFGAQLSVQPEANADVRVVMATGLIPAAMGRAPDGRAPWPFHYTGEARLDVKVYGRGTAAAEAELLGAQLAGRVDERTGSVEFALRGQLRAQKAGARIRLLTGQAALAGIPAAEGWRVELVSSGEQACGYDVVAEREGTFAVELTFAAAVRESGDWRSVEFAMPAGAVVPLELEGLGAEVSFKPEARVVPAATGEGAARRWRGFLPADGVVALAWKRAREATEGALAFTSAELADVRIGAGLMRQSSQITFRVLQGKLAPVRVQVDGPGEILGVEGANVVGWKVLPGESGRRLEVRLSRPLEAEGVLTIHSQTELGSWPARAEPIRLTPEGGVRHSGMVRVANSGAVRLEMTDVSGVLQLAPGQYPGAPLEAGARQAFVYRFPSASYGYRVVATQIQPEVGVAVIALYELGETARVIDASLELDIREAPLREWSLLIPDDHAVVALTGSDVADYVVETDSADGRRVLRVLFGRAIEGRQLLQVRLEKNQPAAAGEWALRTLHFPGAKTVRGHVGAVATPGYRLAPVRVERLVEVPLSYFPRQAARLQQAWRLREADWTAELRAEALGQSVQADVFHLYSLKAGVVTSSVLLNYFVVGAPAAEWRIEVPAGVGNIDVVGQNVRRDWRREGDQLIVSLHQPVLGAATLLVTFEQPMSARGGVIQPGVVRPIGVQAERGYLHVVSPLQVKHDVRRAEGALLKLEPAELPAEFRTFTTAPSLAAYHYTARPFVLEMNIEWYAPGETVEQVVDFAKLSSQVARDGQVVTEATFFVKTRGRKALRLRLPEDVKLWEAKVDNEVVNARADGGHTLLPLPARANPNDPVVVALRVGQAARGRGTGVRLVAPTATAPTVISEWKVRGDTGKVLVPQGGNAELVRPALTESGFEWISERGAEGTFAVLSLIGLGLLLLRASTGWRVMTGLLTCSVAAGLAWVMMGKAWFERRPNASELDYAATIVPAGDAMGLELANVAAWQAMLVPWGLAAAVAGAALSVMGGRWTGWRQAFAVTAGVAAMAAGLLAQRGGAIVFFGATGIAVLLRLFVPALLEWRRARATREEPPAAEPGAGAATVVSALALMGTVALGGLPSDARGAVPRSVPAVAPLPAGQGENAPLLSDGTRAAQAIVQRWSIRGERLFAEAELTVRGKAGDSFVLLRAPAVLTDFSSDGLHVAKADREGGAVYHITPVRDGLVTAQFRFELAVPDRAARLALPTGPAAVEKVTIEMDQGGWEFGSPMAVSVSPLPESEGRSGATLVLARHATPWIQAQPRRRDVGAETTQFFAETSTAFVPGPGVVNGFARVAVRPVQGRVTQLELEIPEGFIVGEVGRGPVGAWRFDPQARRLQVAIEPAQTSAFQFEIDVQRGAGDLPFALAVEPPRVRGAAGDVGMIALAFGGDAQPESIRATDVSVVNVHDFDASLLPRTREGQPLATLQHAWRYGAGPGRVELKVAPVAPDVRVTSRQVLSLDDDRMLMAVDLRVTVARVGVFKLSFALPEGLEVEALTGEALSQWTETVEGGRRIVALHLKGRTLGEHTFNLTLAGMAPGAQGAWAFPRLAVREATRQTGEALVVPGRGIRLRAVEREKVTQLDPRSVGGQPGALAFRLLQEDWVLRLGIEMLEPWVTVQALTEATLREGQTLTRLAVRYRVENAAVKQLRVRLPGLGEDTARTVRATGPAVGDIVRAADMPDAWDIRFQRGIAGETDVQIEFQSVSAREAGREAIVTPEFVGARQVAQFVAVRGGGRLELEAGTLPRGWTRVDWSAVPSHLPARTDRSMPALCYRVAEPEGGLEVTVRRHEVAEALKLRVTQGELLTLFAPTGAFLTAVELKIDVLEKSTLRVRLPEGARLFNTLVNGESVAVVREGDAWLFHVTPSAAGERGAVVRLAYAAEPAPDGRVTLRGPSLSVPLENVTWRVVIPPGHELEDYRGGLRLREERLGRSFGVEDYQSFVSSKRSAEAREAMTILQQASSWMQKGEQEKAVEALSRVSNAVSLDEASNEDARVQLRSLKTQQAMLGLNTRRQKLYLDNRADAARNEQLEQAANLNPFLQGKANFQPHEVDRLLMGNTAEENTALRGIAARIVDQQLGADPAPGAIDVTLPERGRVLTFTRSVQVDGAAPLQLTLDVRRVTQANPILGGVLLAAIAALAGMQFATKRAERT